MANLTDIPFDGGALASTVDSALRIRFALEAYHGALSDALNTRFREHGSESACESLREGLKATEAHISRVRDAIASAYVDYDATPKGL